MADEAGKPLLDRGSRSPSPHRSSSVWQSSSFHHHSSQQTSSSFQLSSESTPLLIRRDNELAYGICEPIPISASTSRSASPERSTKKPRNRLRWAIVLPLVILAAVVAVLVFAFVAPAVVKQYVKEATVFQATDISVDSATENGVRARVQGNVVLDAGRVRTTPVRNIGRFATWIAREVETDQSELYVYLPEYGNVLIGTAVLPPIKVAIRNGHVNPLDFVADLAAGDIHGIRGVALDWLEGRLGRLRIKGKTTLQLKSGLLDLGKQTLSDDLTFEEKDFPALPQVKITNFDVHETDSSSQNGVAANASLAAWIDSPFKLSIPALAFDILIPNCSPGEPYISVADASTQEVQINPGQLTNLNVSGLIRSLSDELTTACPGQTSSPLDVLVKSYIHGLQTTIYVRGANAPSLHTPEWVVDLLKSVTVPLPFTGHALENLVKNFTMSDTHFSLPDPFAEPDTPEAQPKVSALMKVLVAIPKQLNLNMDIPRVRANADVYYKGDKFGVLELPKWQPANSSLVNDTDGSPDLLVEFAMKDAPLRVTDGDVLTDVLQSLMFGGKPVELHLIAAVDAELSTGLGKFAIRGIPAESDVNVKSPFGGSIHQLLPRIESTDIESTTETSVLVNTMMNFTNPTQYSVTVPLIDFSMLYNETAVAHIIGRNLSIIPGFNSGLHVDLLWSPLDAGGLDGVIAGREMLSRYVSGANSTVMIKPHQGTIPALPELGKAFSRFQFEVPFPTVPNERPHFIQDATLHLWSMTAEFILFSPLTKTNLQITSVDATAFYQKDIAIGSINYYKPFTVPPGISPTPRLPVDLVMSGIGYDAVVKALGGELELDFVADIGIGIGEYRDIMRYKGKGIGAKVRLLP